MKSELWSKVKRGDYLIYADETDGVQKVKVVEIDITIEVFEPEYRKEQPYGLTAETGYVKIQYTVLTVTYEIIENLASLIKFNLTYYRRLKARYDTWRSAQATAETYKEDFIGLRADYREK